MTIPITYHDVKYGTPAGKAWLKQKDSTGPYIMTPTKKASKKKKKSKLKVT